MRPFPALWIAAVLSLVPATAQAQYEAFVEAVREAAVAPADVAAIAPRLQHSLEEWDKNLKTLEDQVTAGLKGAPDTRAAQLHVELGVAFRVRGRLADAVREFDASVRLRPSGSDVRVLRALTLEAAGRPAEAAQSFQEAWSLDASDPIKAYYVASRPGVDRAARDKARAFLASRLAEGFPRPAGPPFLVLDAIPDTLSQKLVVGDEKAADAFALFAGGKYKEAIAALSHPPRADSPLAHLAAGQVAEAQNRVADARREYQAALGGTLAGRGVILVALGRLAQVDGDIGAAIDALTRAVRLAPNDVRYRRELAAALAADGRIDDALVEITATLLIVPSDAQGYATIGQLQLDAGRYVDAVSAFYRALELAPDRYEVRYSLAATYMRLGDDAKAALQLQAYDLARRDALERRRKELGGRE